MSHVVRRAADDPLRSEAQIGLFWEALWLANGGRTVFGGPQRPAHDADLRPAATQGHAEYRGADLDLTDLHSSASEREGGNPCSAFLSRNFCVCRVQPNISPSCGHLARCLVVTCRWADHFFDRHDAPLFGR